MTTPSRRTLSHCTTLCVLLTAAALPGCSPPTGPPVTVVVATASSAEPAPSIEPIKKMLTDRALATTTPGGATVELVVSGRPDIQYVDLTPMRNFEVEAVPDRAAHLVAEHVDELAATLAALTPGSDELDLLTTYDRGLRATGDGGTVVVLSSGIQTVDPLDLTKLGWSFDPKTVVDDLARRGAIPDAHDKHVVMDGIGVAMGTQPPLARPQRQLLQQLWFDICQAGGALSCEVTDSADSLTMPTSTRPVSVVTVPNLGTAESPCRATTLSIPDTVLFEPDTAVLRPGTDTALSGLATQLAQCPTGARVAVIGHTADVNPDQIDGQELSDQRARLCRDRLVALGVPASVFTDVRGVADTQPRVADIVDGVFTESLAALNRRVDITVEIP